MEERRRLVRLGLVSGYVTAGAAVCTSVVLMMVWARQRNDELNRVSMTAFSAPYGGLVAAIVVVAVLTSILVSTGLAARGFAPARRRLIGLTASAMLLTGLALAALPWMVDLLDRAQSQ